MKGILAALLLILAALPAMASRQIVTDSSTFAPFIIFDPVMNKFRIWFNRRTTTDHILLGYRDSDDTVTWGPGSILRDDPAPGNAAWGAGVVDTGIAGPQRFWHPFYWAGPGANGLYFSWSADGLTFTWPTSFVTPTIPGVGDRVDPFINPLGGYGIFVKKETPEGLRETWLTLSNDLVTWTEPTRLAWADGDDHPKTEFYGAACCVVRNGVLIGFLRVLRDDVERGIGYTVLIWSRDGKTWGRSRKPFFERCRGTRDQAHAWIYGVVERNGTVYFSYSAYPDGHKTGERFVGVATMPSASLTIDSDGAGPGC
jgi:hypothetical protein